MECISVEFNNNNGGRVAISPFKTSKSNTRAPGFLPKTLKVFVAPASDDAFINQYKKVFVLQN